MNLAEIIARHAIDRSEVVALADGERTLTYRALDRQIRLGATQLRSLGIEPGDAVAICLKDTADHVIAFLSAARLGAVSVPIDWRAPPGERARVAQGFGAKLALTEAGAGRVAGVPSRAVDATWYAEVERQSVDHEFRSDADAALMIGLTSGTTGAIKGMLVTHRQMHARARPFDEILGDRLHRYLSASPLAFSAGRNYCLTHIIKGQTVIFHPSLFTAEEYVEAINRHRATGGFVVPTVIRWLLDLPRGDGPLMPNVEVLMCGGAPLRAEDKRAMLAHVTPNFYEFYGTVATGPISFLRPGEMAVHAESAGRPAAGWELSIVDEDERPVEPGSAGRLRTRGPALASGLVGDTTSAIEGFRNGWYYTGDLAALGADGFLYLRGRATDVILRGGSNVHPDEIEAILLEHPAVAEAAVVGRPSRELGEEVVAFAVARGSVEPEALIDHCRKRLTAFKVPCEIVLVADLPRTSFGKVDRKRLRSSLIS
ncbi:MAG TPA: class I adenylate-forming enzyme family protein [Stellaceae bacterium]|nr:class I adenylate-forming enzyme family protein [Stellaceae bacterium]